MRSMKAVAFREPWASRLASGQDSVGFRGSRTGHRGELLIVSDSEPGYALGIAQLVDCRPITAEDRAPLRRGYAWVFQNAAPVSRFRLLPQHGLFSAEVPEGALGEQQRSQPQQPAPAPPGRPQSVKTGFGEHALAARTAAGRLSLLVGELRAELPAAAHQRLEAAVRTLHDGAEALVHEMVNGDARWRAQLAPWTSSPEQAIRGPDAPSPGARSSCRLNILIIDDEPRFARGVQRTLAGQHDVRVALSKREAFDQLAARIPDVMLCDYRLEWQTTEDLLAFVRDNHPGVRRVLYSFSRIELWCDLLDRHLIHAAVPKSAPRAELLSALG